MKKIQSKLRVSKPAVASNAMTSMKSKATLLTSLVAAGLASVPAHAVVVSISGTANQQADNQPIIDFISTNFTNATTINYGDYSNPANIPAGTEVLIVARDLSSTSYSNATNSATFNALTIPVVSFTSYVTRPDADRWGWHSGGVSGGVLVDGSESMVTSEGATVFGVTTGAYDWFSGTGTFFDTGTGTVGTGDILAQIGTTILAAGWTTGETSGSAATFGGNRLLFNAFQTSGGGTFIPDTTAGQEALTSSLAFYTPLTPVPEPSVALLGLGGLALLRRRRA